MSVEIAAAADDDRHGERKSAEEREGEIRMPQQYWEWEVVAEWEVKINARVDVFGQNRIRLSV